MLHLACESWWVSKLPTSCSAYEDTVKKPEEKKRLTMTWSCVTPRPPKCVYEVRANRVPVIVGVVASTNSNSANSHEFESIACPGHANRKRTVSGTAVAMVAG
ncbi:hypothetical protein EVAR_69552_1 [Eumeta japonica]|uniref:Uncharacterized protein n=1 Tax=Eumeta variegata TaxID=151549 RepID=A0A4C2A5M0_EUMVA|nr:hypothetical protein EVAR_69552_1 [Eumeta japonica]